MKVGTPLLFNAISVFKHSEAAVSTLRNLSGFLKIKMLKERERGTKKVFKMEREACDEDDRADGPC